MTCAQYSTPKDLMRLAYVSRTVREGSRLQTNYLVFTTKKSKERLLAMLSEQEAEHHAQHPRGRGKVSYSLQRYQAIAHWAKGDAKRETRHMAVAVVEVSRSNSEAAHTGHRLRGYESQRLTAILRDCQL
jgi:hypothetical protein